MVCQPWPLGCTRRPQRPVDALVGEVAAHRSRDRRDLGVVVRGPAGRVAVALSTGVHIRPQNGEVGDVDVGVDDHAGNRT